jgi:cytochrome c-type biogenesis protein CcmH
MSVFKNLILIILVSIMQTVSAESIEATKFSSDKQESRYKDLVAEIRCPVCQGQSIGGSNAGLAKDLRLKVREMIIGEKSDDEIRGFMVQRYGDFVVFKPPVKKATYILWFAPFIFLGIALFMFTRSLTKKKDVVVKTVDTSKAEELLK